jgi:hypothetical protein
MSGQLSYDGSQGVGEGGADDDIRETDLLPSPLEFLGGWTVPFSVLELLSSSANVVVRH